MEQNTKAIKQITADHPWITEEKFAASNKTKAKERGGMNTERRARLENRLTDDLYYKEEPDPLFKEGDAKEQP